MSVAGVLALLLHAALLTGAATVLLLLRPQEAARVAGRQPPPWVQPFRDITRLLRKRPIMPEGALLLGRGVVVDLALTVLAGLLVPSFATGMVTAPLADLLVVGALLTAGCLAAALAAFDTGGASADLRAAGSLRHVLLAQAALVIIAMAIGLYAGTTNLDAAVASMREAGGPGVAVALALAAIGCLAAGLDDAPPEELSAWHAAAAMATAALRRVILLSLIAALLLPGTLAAVDAGTGAWLLAMLAWAGKLAVLAIALVLARPDAARWHGMAALLAVLALLLVFVRQAPA